MATLIAREELYGSFEGNGHFCSPKCCTKEIKQGCQKDDICIATGCCGMAPCCFVQYFKTPCFGENTYCMWIYMSVDVVTFKDKDTYGPACCNCGDGWVRKTGGAPTATNAEMER